MQQGYVVGLTDLLSGQFVDEGICENFVGIIPRSGSLCSLFSDGCAAFFLQLVLVLYYASLHRSMDH